MSRSPQLSNCRRQTPLILSRLERVISKITSLSSLVESDTGRNDVFVPSQASPAPVRTQRICRNSQAPRFWTSRRQGRHAPRIPVSLFRPPNNLEVTNQIGTGAV